MASKGFPNPIDVHVGQRVRQERTLLGMSAQIQLDSREGFICRKVRAAQIGASRERSAKPYRVGAFSGGLDLAH